MKWSKLETEHILFCSNLAKIVAFEKRTYTKTIIDACQTSIWPLKEKRIIRQLIFSLGAKVIYFKLMQNCSNEV